MRIPALLLFACMVSLAATAACSNQGEGEFCDILAGNNDCQNGLQCVPAPGLPSVANGDTDRCCPIVQGTATTAACIEVMTMLDADTAVPDGAVDGTTSTPDADMTSVVEGSADGTSEAASSPGDGAASAAPDATLASGTDAGAASDASDGAHE